MNMVAIRVADVDLDNAEFADRGQPAGLALGVKGSDHTLETIGENREMLEPDVGRIGSWGGLDSDQMDDRVNACRERVVRVE